MATSDRSSAFGVRLRNSVRIELDRTARKEVVERFGRRYLTASVLKGLFGLSPTEVLAVQDTGDPKAFDVSFFGLRACLEFMEAWRREVRNPVLESLKIRTLFQQDQYTPLVVRVFNPFVQDGDVDALLRRHVADLKGGTRLEDEDGFWTCKRRFAMKLKKDQRTGNLIHPPGTLFMGPEKVFLSYPGQPMYCRRCGGLGHMRDACRGGRCRFCGGTDHEAASCTAPKRCSLCGGEDHLYRACPTRPWSYAGAAGSREAGEERSDTGAVERVGESGEEKAGEDGSEREAADQDKGLSRLAEVSDADMLAMRSGELQQRPLEEVEADGEASGGDLPRGVPLVAPEAVEPEVSASQEEAADAEQEGSRSLDGGLSQQSLLLSPATADAFLTSALVGAVSPFPSESGSEEDMDAESVSLKRRGSSDDEERVRRRKKKDSRRPEAPAEEQAEVLAGAQVVAPEDGAAEVIQHLVELSGSATVETLPEGVDKEAVAKALDWSAGDPGAAPSPAEASCELLEDSGTLGMGESERVSDAGGVEGGGEGVEERRGQGCGGRFPC